ncbi:hypothetical protein D3C71_1839840 [compost metagenome]
MMIIMTPPIFISRFEYFRIQRVEPMKKAKMKNGTAKPIVYAVMSLSHAFGSVAASPIIAVRIGPTHGDQPAENPIPNRNDPM